MQGLPWQTVEECLEYFFWPPERFGEWQNNWHSNLLLLRRDAAQCLGYNPNTYQRCTECFKPVLWPGTLTIFAGIDLLAKFYAGNDNKGKGEISERFKSYVSAFLEGPFDADELWLLRNAMMHSFGLWAKAKGKEYWFSLTERLPVLLQSEEVNGSRFVSLDIMRLWKSFEDSVSKYRDHMFKTYKEMKNLETLLVRYGFTGIHNLILIRHEKR